MNLHMYSLRKYISLKTVGWDTFTNTAHIRRNLDETSKSIVVIDASKLKAVVTKSDTGEFKGELIGNSDLPKSYDKLSWSFANMGLGVQGNS